jgi:hypothetical protein
VSRRNETGTHTRSGELHQRVRFNLERLGHVEFGAAECEDGWRVVPPSLALCQHANMVTGVLCGARTPKLIESVGRAARELSFERASDTDCPDIIRMRAPESENLIELAKREGLLCQVDAPTALLSRLPSVDAIKGWRREPLPTAGKDWDVKQFVIETNGPPMGSRLHSRPTRAPTSTFISCP